MPALASKALRPTLIAPLVRGTRGHAVAVDPPYLPPNPTANTSSQARPRYVDGDVRHDWRRSEIQKIFDAPLMETIYRAATVHRMHQDASRIQLCTLMNIKTGGCTEDCKYCSQSSSYKTPTKASRLIDIEPVLKAAREAKENGSTRFCMGAAWRDLAGKKSGFEKILKMVSEVRGMGMEVCTTLGMLSPDQARRLKEAGLSAYNHNLDTSREFYPEVITSRTYDDRLATIEAVREAGISVCSGGILGLGEQDEDRVGLIHEVSRLPQHPESFPVNTLVPIEGTPLEKNDPVGVHTVLRTIATARIVLPRTIIRLAAGRHTFSETEQAMAFMAGANAIFTGERMLTTPCSGWDEDKAMLGRWGLRGQRSFEDSESVSTTPMMTKEQQALHGVSY
ncbi:biotin synthase [Kwoniella mangroviensis CBS 10435]|uniref:biotin synthase n=1 Tax=Kwoniella mangroviensis CBS 10435 TaxID=1331196 RepID=A0A1B9IXT2_9TREE|nr:biotin synthase [Kwoniella mangroviensis CBS 8507]OCF60333.1 biotin synthase [Kwoniella mangroviensis CBS 10435]OCF69294.1 biotin synthase [Kwoniella mangroviensis CBS 8507]OCF72499.1 biotin synthase [Kwoniella mangroviensis CBS 8886]